MEDFLKETVESTMGVYKTAFEEGKKVGIDEGYRKAHQEFKEMLDGFKNYHDEGQDNILLDRVKDAI